MDAYKRSDLLHAERLKQLLAGVIAEVQNRRALQRAKASMRTFRHTSATSNTHAGLYVVEKSAKVVIVVLAVPLLVAATVGTGGLAPVGMVIAAAAAWGVHKAFSEYRHMLDVNAVLATLAEFERAPESAGPNLSAKELKNTLLMARNMLDKTISDSDKLHKKEIPAYLKELQKLGGGPLPSASDLIKEVLHMGQLAAGSATGQHGALKLLSVTVKSRHAPNAVSLVHLRLQRIRGYMRWVHQLIEGLKSQALQELADAQALEAKLIERISLQVHAGGNHAACDTNLCFGPSSDTEFMDMPASAIDQNAINLSGISAIYGNLNVATFSQAQQSAQIADEQNYSRIDRIIDQGVSAGSDGIGNAAEQLGEVIGDLSTELAGEIAGELFSEFGADALTAAVDQVKQTFRVNRPLFARVKALQDALHESTPATVDAEIVKMAEKNDLKAIRRALDKAIYHYPKRVAERANKFKTMCAKLDARERAGTMGQSVFVNCGEAADALRYLIKIYHNAEKQMIHLHFVGLGLDSLSRNLFGRSVSLTTARRLPVTPGQLAAGILALKPTQEPQVTDPFAFQRALRQKAGELRHVETQQTDPLQAMRAAWEPLQSNREIILHTFIAKGMPGIQGPSPRMMTDKEWSDMSWILGFKTQGTTLIDESLKAYRDSFQRHSVPFAALGLGMPKETHLDELLLHLRTRRAELATTLELAVSTWLKDKEGKEVSRRRASVIDLQTMVQREATALDTMIRAVSQVRQSTAVLGMSSSNRWQDQPVTIEAEDD